MKKIIIFIRRRNGEGEKENVDKDEAEDDHHHHPVQADGNCIQEQFSFILLSMRSFKHSIWLMLLTHQFISLKAR